MPQPQTFPRLNYPLDTRQLTQVERMILIAYDVIWRLEYTQPPEGQELDNLIHDTYAILSDLGYHIEHSIQNGLERFDLSQIPGEEVFSE